MPVGAGVAAAVAMLTVLWAAMRYRDVPGGWVAGLLAFDEHDFELIGKYASTCPHRRDSRQAGSRWHAASAANRVLPAWHATP